MERYKRIFTEAHLNDKIIAKLMGKSDKMLTYVKKEASGHLHDRHHVMGALYDFAYEILHFDLGDYENEAEYIVDTFLMSEYGLGLDGMLHFYKDEKNIFEKEMTEAFIKHTSWADNLPTPYIVKASDMLVEKIGEGLQKGITATAPGFYGPQGRVLRLKLAYPDINSKIETFRFNDKRIANLEMETSALYGLGALLGHETLTICVLIANRVTKKFSTNYKIAMNQLTELVLNRITS